MPMPCPICGRSIDTDQNAGDGRFSCACGYRLVIQEATTQDPAYSDEGRPETIIGRDIAGCHIEVEMGRGAMGGVYRARHQRLDTYVAIKILRHSVVDHEDPTVLRFIREARAAAKLRHPHIVSVFDVGSDAGYHYIIMEYMEGGTLQELQRKVGRIPPETVVRQMIQVTEALEFARENSFIHRDIKPDNLMLDTKGSVKLADFGLAKDIVEDVKITQTSFLLGTPYYMSPEQASNNSAVDHRSDLYSLGCTFYHLLTGQVPYDGATVYTILLQHVSSAVPNPGALVPNAPPLLVDIIIRLMAKEPENRYQTAGDLLIDLRNLAQQLAPPSSPTASTESEARRRANAAAHGLSPTDPVSVPAALSEGTPTPPPGPRPVDETDTGTFPPTSRWAYPAAVSAEGGGTPVPAPPPPFRTTPPPPPVPLPTTTPVPVSRPVKPVAIPLPMTGADASAETRSRETPSVAAAGRAASASEDPDTFPSAPLLTAAPRRAASAPAHRSAMDELSAKIRESRKDEDLEHQKHRSHFIRNVVLIAIAVVLFVVFAGRAGFFHWLLGLNRNTPSRGPGTSAQPYITTGDNFVIPGDTEPLVPSYPVPDGDGRYQESPLLSPSFSSSSTTTAPLLPGPAVQPPTTERLAELRRDFERDRAVSARAALARWREEPLLTAENPPSAPLPAAVTGGAESDMPARRLAYETLLREARTASEEAGRSRQATWWWKTRQAALGALMAGVGDRENEASRLLLKADAEIRAHVYQQIYQRARTAHERALRQNTPENWTGVRTLLLQALAVGHSDVSAARHLLDTLPGALGLPSKSSAPISGTRDTGGSTVTGR